MLETLKEGKRFKIHNLMAGENRYLLVCARYSYFMTIFRLIVRWDLVVSQYFWFYFQRTAGKLQNFTDHDKIH